MRRLCCRTRLAAAVLAAGALLTGCAAPTGARVGINPAHLRPAPNPQACGHPGPDRTALGCDSRAREPGPM